MNDIKTIFLMVKRHIQAGKDDKAVEIIDNFMNALTEREQANREAATRLQHLKVIK